MSDSNILNPDEYLGRSYLNKERWVSYSLQIKLISEFVAKGEILEIGVGNKIVADFLSKKYKLTTVDINPDLKPDIIASVNNLISLVDRKFDASLCFEVLEHLPYSEFKNCLSELRRVSRSYVLLSLPYWGYTFGFKIKIPVLGEWVFKFKVTSLKKHQFNGQHYWELGKKGYQLRRIKKDIIDSDFKIVKSFWDLDDPYHYYFVLMK